MVEISRRDCIKFGIAGGALLALNKFAFLANGAELKDSESASHSDSAANYEIVDTYKYPGFKIIQLKLAVLAHYSYIIISNGEAVIVDPGRDIFKYLELAKDEKCEIKGVILSHTHADFVAGHSEMVNTVGCPIYISEKANAEYKHEPLKEGSLVKVGSATIKVLETPGHTLDSTVSLIYSHDNSTTPKAMFSGDTLFIGSIGRPDLMGGTISAAALASLSYTSWTDKLSKLDDRVAIFPAHGAGSLCGANLSDLPTSTIGKERTANNYLQMRSRSEFIAAILDGLPEAPQYFKYNAAINKKGPELVDWNAVPSIVKPQMQHTDANAYYVVDIRDAKTYAAGHIPNSVNIAVRGRIETWTGVMVPWSSKLVLAGNADELKEATYRLNRVGYKAEVIPFDAWKNSGLPLSRNKLISPEQLYGHMKKGDEPIIVDVRQPSEWAQLRIGMVINMPLNHLEELSDKLDPSEPVVAVCNSAYRSSMSVGIFERKGFKNVNNLEGGSEEWIESGLPVYGTDTKDGKPIKKDK